MKTLGTGGNQACDDAIARIIKAVEDLEHGRAHADGEPVCGLNGDVIGGFWF